VVLDLSRFFSNFSAAGTKGYLNLSSHCYVVGLNRYRSWRSCSGSIARRARNSVALFRRSSVVVVHAMTKVLSIEVGRKHSATNRKASMSHTGIFFHLIVICSSFGIPSMKSALHVKVTDSPRLLNNIFVSHVTSRSIFEGVRSVTKQQPIKMFERDVLHRYDKAKCFYSAFSTKQNLSLHSLYYAEACNVFAGPSPRHSAKIIQLLG